MPAIRTCMHNVVGLITRRSQVQILPPLPPKALVRAFSDQGLVAFRVVLLTDLLAGTRLGRSSEQPNGALKCPRSRLRCLRIRTEAARLGRRTPTGIAGGAFSSARPKNSISRATSTTCLPVALVGSNPVTSTAGAHLLLAGHSLASLRFESSPRFCMPPFHLRWHGDDQTTRASADRVCRNHDPYRLRSIA